MPASRINIWELVNAPLAKSYDSEATLRSARCKEPPPPATLQVCGSSLLIEKDMYYPKRPTERQSYRTSSGKKLSPHQWAVYDYTLTIPVGRVSTYKMVCDALGQGSPRSVGCALKRNPFAPYVPCHRVIASNLYLGGFHGEWGPRSKTGTQFMRKINILANEGVEFDANGMLKSPDALWL